MILNDDALFTAGSLLTIDYLTVGIRDTPAYLAVEPAPLRLALLEITGRFPHQHKPSETQTEDDFIWPVLHALGWDDHLRQLNLTPSGRDDVPDGLLFQDATAKAAANTHAEEWKRYAYGLAAVESKRWARPLDRASGRDETTAPSTQMLRYLRRIDDTTGGKLRWGILSNGARWRLYWAGARSVSEEFFEIDLARILGLKGQDLFAADTEQEHWLRVFAVMFGRSAFIRDGADQRSFLERAREAAAFYERRVAANLSRLVFDQVFPSLARAIAAADPDAALSTVRDAALILLYRLLFLLYAEDRDLLPVKDSRYREYALRPLRVEIGRRVTNGEVFSATASRLWAQIADLSKMIDTGDVSVGIPPYNGGLFTAEATPLLATIRLADSVIAPTIDALSYERSAGGQRYINYRDLSVQQLGSIYERLLEFELVRHETGLIDVRPKLFARKSSGSYYTPDDLVGLILEETLEPLIADRLQAFRIVLAALDPAQPEDPGRYALRKADPATAILALRVCDPAMGSGHFLVSLVDTLADHVLDAMAEAAVAAAPFHYTSPLAEKIEEIRTTILANAAASRWTIDQGQLDDRHIVRRMVLKRCVFGVDKNPMAVELAKVALWLHTFTVGAPLSFIDHHLHCGDSLFGLWIHDAIGRATTVGVSKTLGTDGGLLYAAALRQAQRSAEIMRTIEALTDVEIAEAHRSAAMYANVEDMTGDLDGFVNFVHAVDWLNLNREGKALVRLWLDGGFGDPIPIARGLKAPEKAKPEEIAAFTTLWQQAQEIVAEQRFLNWQVSFPGVWRDWAGADREGGFDAVVGNPPWDRMKLQQVEWFAARRPAIAMAQRASDRARMIAALRTGADPLWDDFAHAEARAAAAARVARASGHYPLLGGGDVNLYSLFVERAQSLVKPGGMVGLLVPSGIASDLSASAFFKRIATGEHLKSLHDFENKRVFFPDVDSRFKFCAIVFSPQRVFPAATCAFFLHAVQERRDPERAFAITAAEFAAVNPNTGTAPIFRTRRDMALTTAIYGRLPVLVDRSGPAPVQAIPVRYVRMFDMTNDSHLFRTRAELEEREGAWPVGGNRYQSAAGEWVPLYEGKMVQAYDHRAASIVVNAANLNRPAQPLAATALQSANRTWFGAPQFWVQATSGLGSHPYTLGFKDVTAPTNVRSMIASVVPSGAAGNTLPLIEIAPEVARPNPKRFSLLTANLNAVVYDYIARQKIQGQHLNWFIVEQLPVVPPDAYNRQFGPKTAATIVQEAVLELTYTAHDMAPFARDMGYVDGAGAVRPPFVWNDDRRLQLRAKLDALYFILYGVIDPTRPETRDDVRYIYGTFPIVEREETARWGSYRSRDLCLAWINALLAGQPDAAIAG